MKASLLQILLCPQSLLPLRLENRANSETSEAHLVSADGSCFYPIRDGIPRFVPESNYSDNFGMQWNHFAKTQLDSHSGTTISADRFWKATGWSSVDMRDKWVLDVGCGSGRFAEIALSSGAQVVALDYSSAVDACLANLKHNPNLHVVQGDVFSLPFVPGSFDFVYSLGVLQHTPDVARAFAALPPMLVEGGYLCTDFYWKRFQTMIHIKYLLRPLTTRIEQQKLFSYLEKAVPLMLPISQALRRVPLIGKALQRFIPVADYSQTYHLTEQQLKEWALLDTFDWLAPRYDYPQTQKAVKHLFSKAGFTAIDIFHAGHLVGRSVKEYSEPSQ
jgi:SAM-dependent methyltransferase